MLNQQVATKKIKLQKKKNSFFGCDEIFLPIKNFVTIN
jgi:hypothetical protein